MRRAVLIVAVMANAFLSHAAEKNRFHPELLVQGEYRRDTIDYNDVEKQFFREKISLIFNKKSSFNLAHIYISASKENRFSWNIAVRDVSPYFSCIIGNYHINFGAGLIAGKKTGINPDLFSRRIVVSRYQSYVPCSSGNPLYSYQGVAASVSYSFTDVSVSLSSFFSYRNRYAGNEVYGAGNTTDSYSSIIYRTVRDDRHSEPVEINDYGCSADIRLGEHILVQGYFFYSDIRRNRKNLLWNLNGQGLLRGADSGYYGYGLFAQYHDGYITIFAELGIPNRIVRLESGKDAVIRDYGLVCGMTFRHQTVHLSLTGKHSGKNFYSPYSSGNGYAENAWMADGSVTPVKMLTLGGGIFSEKRLSTGYADTYLTCNRREQAYVLFRLPRTVSLKLKFNYLEKSKQFGAERYAQIKPYVSCTIGPVLLSFAGMAQKKSGANWSSSLCPGIGLTVFNCITVRLHYSWFHISNNNYLYSVIAPYPGAISSGTFIKNTSHAAAGKFSVRYSDAVFSVRYEHQFYGRKSIRNRIELYGKCLL